MNPRLNKLITLLLLLGTFTFLMELESKVTAIAKKELSEWASFLHLEQSDQWIIEPDSFARKVNRIKSFNPLSANYHSEY